VAVFTAALDLFFTITTDADAAAIDFVFLFNWLIFPELLHLGWVPQKEILCGLLKQCSYYRPDMYPSCCPSSSVKALMLFM